MPTYTYRAKKGPHDVIEGKIEAETEKEAIDKLSRTGYLPLRVEAKKEAGESKSHPVSKKYVKAKSREVTIFSRQLASLLKSGVPILHALNIISEQSESPALKGILRHIHDAVKDGATFSSTLEEYPRVFSSLYIAMIRSGEDSGTLPEVLLRVADYRSKQEWDTFNL